MQERKENSSPYKYRSEMFPCRSLTTVLRGVPGRWGWMAPEAASLRQPSLETPLLASVLRSQHHFPFSQIDFLIHQKSHLPLPSYDFFFLKMLYGHSGEKKKNRRKSRVASRWAYSDSCLSFLLFFPSTALLRVLVKNELPPPWLSVSLSERLLISEMCFIRLMDEAINFFFDWAFLVRDKLSVVLSPCPTVCLFCFLLPQGKSRAS